MPEPIFVSRGWCHLRRNISFLQAAICRHNINFRRNSVAPFSAVISIFFEDAIFSRNIKIPRDRVEPFSAAISPCILSGVLLELQHAPLSSSTSYTHIDIRQRHRILTTSCSSSSNTYLDRTYTAKYTVAC